MTEFQFKKLKDAIFFLGDWFLKEQQKKLCRSVHSSDYFGFFFMSVSLNKLADEAV